MNVTLVDIFAPPILALVLLLLGWSFVRVLTGAPLTPYFRKLLLYTCLFVLGMGYAMAAVAVFAWPRWTILVLSLAWAGILIVRFRQGSGAGAAEEGAAGEGAAWEGPNTEGTSIDGAAETRARARLIGGARPGLERSGPGRRRGPQVIESSCPMCGGKRVDRVPATGIVEKLKEMRGFHVYHCLRCYGRFYRKEDQPRSEFARDIQNGS